MNLPVSSGRGDTNNMTIHSITLESTQLTRVGYIDVDIDPSVAGLLAKDFSSIDWREPEWTSGNQLRAGAAIWFADTTTQRIAFDPVQAADDVLRGDPDTEQAQQAAIAELLATSGFDRASVDLLVMSHIEGIGMCAWHHPDGNWSPFFPNATILVSDDALASFLSRDRADTDDPEYDAWHALLDQGVVATFNDGDTISGDLTAQISGGHCPGHTIFHFGVNPKAPAATMLGHLAISPVHLATGECPRQHFQPDVAWSTLQQARSDDRLLIGPLWPGPGSGRWRDNTFVATT